MQRDKIAIIDLGTNTFHLLIAETGPREEYVIRGKFKEMVKLGEGGINEGHIAPPAFQRGIDTLRNFRKLIDSAGVSYVFAFATSAMRGADNAEAFITAAREEANIDIRVINGNMEASYIHEGVKNGVHLPTGRDVLIMDIGGGSVEFAVSRDRQALLLRSLDIGAARLLEKVEPADPPTKKDWSEVKAILKKELKGLVEELREFDLGLMVGSSGTFETLASIIAIKKGDLLSAENLNGYRFSPKDFRKAWKQIKNASHDERLKISGMEAQRVDMILMGGAMVAYLLKQVPIEDILVSSFSLKEGILYRHMKDKRRRVQLYIGETEKNLRAKAVRQLAERYNYDQAHVVKVSELASQLFDGLEELHHYGQQEREFLQYACVLHDIGRYLHPSGHHKHGQYIIINSNLSGFSTNDLVLLGNLVRYHRRSLPKRDHFHYNVMPEKTKEVVQLLSGILRIADNLDRGHRNLITHLRVEVNDERISVNVYAKEDVSMEIDHALQERHLLEKATGKQIEIVQVSA